MNNYKSELLNKIQKLISGSEGVPEFENNYYQYYLDEVPQDKLSDLEADFFGLIQEKLDWVAEKPSEQERKDGWIDFSEYIKFVKDNTQSFLNNEEEWHKEYISSWKNEKSI